MSAPISLRRTGSGPLVLGDGWRKVASASSHRPEGFLSQRFHEADVWRRADYGALALAVRYVTTWKGEVGREWAIPLVPRAGEEGQTLAECLTADDAEWFAYVAGFPPGKEFAERQERLLDALEAGWDHLVSDILEAAAAAS